MTKWNDKRLELLEKKKTQKLTARETEELRLMERCVQYQDTPPQIVDGSRPKVDVLKKLIEKLRSLGYGI